MITRVTAHIDLAALKHNFRRVKTLAPHSKVLAMIKGNAYGHGMVPVAQTLTQADFFGVATLEEAAALRAAGIRQAIVLMSGVYEAESLREAVELRCQCVVHSWDQVQLLEQENIFPEAIWIKMDTGMHRYGFIETDASTAYQVLQKSNRPVYWMTHFACADAPNHAGVKAQLAAFKQFTQALTESKSVANSAGILQYPDSHADVVRPGMMLYGASPVQHQSAADCGLLPVMTLTAHIVALHSVPTGGLVGYGSTWQAERPSMIAVVSAGYADGYPQAMPSGAPVLVRQQIARIAGRVSMDALMIDVTDIPAATVGDEVILWGKGLPVEQVAHSMKGSVYALLTGVMPRVHYRYF